MMKFILNFLVNLVSCYWGNIYIEIVDNINEKDVFKEFLIKASLYQNYQLYLLEVFIFSLKHHIYKNIINMNQELKWVFYTMIVLRVSQLFIDYNYDRAD